MTVGPVLVVEDDMVLADLLALVLDGLGTSIECVPDGAAALQAVHQLRPSVVLLDMYLPKIDGFQVARTLKADPTTRSIPIICVSALHWTGSIALAFEAGCDEYVAKPVDIQQLEDAIRKYLLQTMPGDDSADVIDPPLTQTISPSSARDVPAG